MYYHSSSWLVVGERIAFLTFSPPPQSGSSSLGTIISPMPFFVESTGALQLKNRATNVPLFLGFLPVLFGGILKAGKTDKNHYQR
jgi:hypothetical protein